MYRAPLSNISEGFLTNFLNPAIATFYLVVVPQFVPPGAPVARSVLLLMTVHVATALTWHLVWAAAGAALARTLSAGPARRALDGATAVALLSLAVRVLTRREPLCAGSRFRGSRFGRSLRAHPNPRPREPRTAILWPAGCIPQRRRPLVEELGLTGSSQARVEAAQAKELEKELTEQEKRDNVVRLAFAGDEARFQAFIDAIAAAIPPATGVVLRGSAVTGRRWKDGALFDAEGAGTSDLDLTLVGDDVIGFYKVTGFFVPGVHSRPISKDDPDIAPDLTPLRERLMAMVKRPVNIQATRDFVMYVRGELLGQPYLVLIDKTPETEGA